MSRIFRIAIRPMDHEAYCPTPPIAGTPEDAGEEELHMVDALNLSIAPTAKEIQVPECIVNMAIEIANESLDARGMGDVRFMLIGEVQVGQA